MSSVRPYFTVTFLAVNSWALSASSLGNTGGDKTRWFQSPWLCPRPWGKTKTEWAPRPVCVCVDSLDGTSWDVAEKGPEFIWKASLALPSVGRDGDTVQHRSHRPHRTLPCSSEEMPSLTREGKERLLNWLNQLSSYISYELNIQLKHFQKQNLTKSSLKVI